ncbi:hypothetical protein [Caulobacter soli]|uniref:hypothetical protein n=1 Tax=Caulobacter soli TaxID=2708539 RepID=UPI0013EAA8A3|nr:hypothetical protein [Caulobacter soli]
MVTLRKTQLIAGAAVAVVLAALGVGLAVYVGRDTHTEVVDHKVDDAEAIEGARIAVTGRLPEAQAVNFGKVFVHWDGEIPSVCGEVDIIEEQDSFDGEERFIWSQGALTLEEIDGSDVVDQKWGDLCE